MSAEWILLSLAFVALLLMLADGLDVSHRVREWRREADEARDE